MRPLTYVGMLFAGLLAAAPHAAAVEYMGDTYRDPFENQLPKEVVVVKDQAPVSVNTTPIEDLLDVQGTVWNSPRPQALINGAIVKVGNTVHGAEIVSIGIEGVEVFYQGQTYLLRPGKD